jgi:hypothetical protein
MVSSAGLRIMAPNAGKSPGRGLMRKNLREIHIEREECFELIQKGLGEIREVQ